MKIKEGMEKGQKAGEGKTENLGIETKRKGWFQDGGMGEVDAGFAGDIQGTEAELHEALENELNKQGLGGSGQNALEKMKEIENKY
jgi:hypothetical protein